MGILWLRSEIKPGEQRAPLSPSDAGFLIKNGHTVYVESSDNRIFKNQEYQKLGCTLVDEGTWSSAPHKALILGLKYLPDQHEGLTHRHCYFSHAYNIERIFTEKPGVPPLLKAFHKGGGTLYDIEFLLDDQGKRIAAFGFFAGFAGAAIGLLLGEKKWIGTNDFKLPVPFLSQEKMIKMLMNSLDHMKRKRSLIIGSQGRCARGVKSLLNMMNIPYDEWTRKETSNPALLKTMVEYDVLYNCTYAQEKREPFLTKKCLTSSQNLSLFIDISCETSQNNFFPLYSEPTTFLNPVHRITLDDFNLDIIAIDNLPNALPFESSIEFSAQILPHLNDMLNDRITYPWINAEKIFYSHLKPDRL